jgi:hypothetical protein
MFDDYSIGVNPDVRDSIFFTVSSLWKLRYRIITGFTTLSTVVPDARRMAEFFIETQTSLNVIFPHQVFYGTTLGNVSSTCQGHWESRSLGNSDARY